MVAEIRPKLAKNYFYYHYGVTICKISVSATPVMSFYIRNQDPLLIHIHFYKVSIFMCLFYPLYSRIFL